MASSYNRSRGHHRRGASDHFSFPRRSFVWIYQDIGSREGVGFSRGFSFVWDFRGRGSPKEGDIFCAPVRLRGVPRCLPTYTQQQFDSLNKCQCSLVLDQMTHQPKSDASKQRRRKATTGSANSTTSCFPRICTHLGEKGKRKERDCGVCSRPRSKAFRPFAPNPPHHLLVCCSRGEEMRIRPNSWPERGNTAIETPRLAKKPLHASI